MRAEPRWLRILGFEQGNRRHDFRGTPRTFHVAKQQMTHTWQTHMKFAVTPLVLTPCVPFRDMDIYVGSDEAAAAQPTIRTDGQRGPGRFIRLYYVCLSCLCISLVILFYPLWFSVFGDTPDWSSVTTITVIGLLPLLLPLLLFCSVLYDLVSLVYCFIL